MGIHGSWAAIKVLVMFHGAVRYLALSGSYNIEQGIILDRLIFLHYVADAVTYQLGFGNVALSRQPVQFTVEGWLQIKLHPVHALVIRALEIVYTPTLVHSDVYVNIS